MPTELLRTIDLSAAGADQALRAIRDPLSVEGLIAGESDELRTVMKVFAEVRARGDAAVAGFTRQWDQVELAPGQFRVPEADLRAAHAALPPTLLRAIRQAADSLLAFQSALVEQAGRDVAWSNPALGTSATLASRAVPLDSAACMVPAASAPLPSSVLHTALCARAAGVGRIALFSPPRFAGSVHPVILGTAWEIGVREVYRVGGAQAVAAAALGTAAIPRVAKIVGPGNVFVALAKKLAFGLVDIDSFAGPSEVLILADDSANPAYVAADMLAQAEHDPGCAVLVVWQREIVGPILAELARQLEALPRRDQTRRCLERFSAVVVTPSREAAVAFANQFASEHLEVNCRDATTLARELTTAGAVFVGPFTPEAVGDYLAGPSHVLPTGGSARFFSGLSSLSFLRRQSMLTYTQSAIERQADAVAVFAQAEQLDAHARSAQVRVPIG